MKTMETEHQEIIEKNEKKIERLELFVEKSNNLHHSYVELFSKSILISVEARVNNERLKLLLEEFSKEKKKLEEISKEKESFKEQLEESEQRIKDMKVEFTSRTKMTEKQLKELKSLLAERQKEEESPKSPRKSLSNSRRSSLDKPSPMNENNENHNSPRNERFQRSLSSGESDDNTSLVNDLETSTLIKENNALLIRLGELQTIKWKMEERLRVLSISAEQLKEDVEKKKHIITYYMQKEKLGRLTPEQEKNKAIMLQKSKKMDPKVLQESFNQMQQVMEETILQNIQLQSHVKTLGGEIQRLLNENKKLQEKV
jgi:prolyl oligopeptidase PreP (S9A serine peptidase family)